MPHIGLIAPWFSVLALEISGRDLILILGGLFLVAKSTVEIHDKRIWPRRLSSSLT